MYDLYIELVVLVNADPVDQLSSPDFNPIEQCWSKVKEFLRAAEARTADALQQAIANAFATVTASDAPGWFQHCGYRLT
jgi:hypothetical protein